MVITHIKSENMVLFLKPQEIHSSLNTLVLYYFNVCEQSGEIPQQLVQLIKHNFSAKYVWYNIPEKKIEIGINESKSPGCGYPDIQVYSYPIDQYGWIEKSHKNEAFDLNFYGKLLNNKSSMASEIVIL